MAGASGAEAAPTSGDRRSKEPRPDDFRDRRQADLGLCPLCVGCASERSLCAWADCRCPATAAAPNREGRVIGDHRALRAVYHSIGSRLAARRPANSITVCRASGARFGTACKLGRACAGDQCLNRMRRCVGYLRSVGLPQSERDGTAGSQSSAAVVFTGGVFRRGGGASPRLVLPSRKRMLAASGAFAG
jgi:hypothetical protein